MDSGRDDAFFLKWKDVLNSPLSLEAIGQKTLESQVSRYPSPLILKQREALHRKNYYPNIHPVSQWILPTAHHQKTGEDTLAQGRVASLILAGGQGTRLGSHHPKALLSVSNIKSKTLLQLFLEKVYFAQIKYNAALEAVVMTSIHNHSEILTYLEGNNFFGLDRGCIHLVMQEDLPFLNEEGKWMCDENGNLLQGPDGNGRVFHVLEKNSLLERWAAKNIDYLNIVLIDNPLADPYEASLVGIAHETGSEIVAKAIKRENEEEKVGIFAEIDEQVRVIEYSECDPAIFKEKSGAHELKYGLANTSMFCFDLRFINRMIKQIELPYHMAKKKASPDSSEYIWKTETFLFDWLQFSKKVKVALYERKECFSPLKNATGLSSFETVHQDLLEKDYNTWKRITGTAAPKRAIELSKAFEYPTPFLLKKWQGKEFPDTDYIEA